MQLRSALALWMKSSTANRWLLLLLTAPPHRLIPALLHDDQQTVRPKQARQKPVGRLRSHSMVNTSIRSVRSGTAFHGRNFNRFFRILSPRRHATIALCQLRSQGSEKRRFPSNFYEELMYVQFEIKKNFLIYYFQKFNLLLFSAVWWTFTIQFYVKAGEERQARSHGGIRGQFPQIFCTSPNFIFPRKICLNIQ